MREITRHEDGSSSWKCSCGTTVFRYRGRGDVSCSECGNWYNAFGQRLRNDWQGNQSNYDDDVSDLDGYELQYANDQ